MASTSSRVTAPERDASLQVLSSLLENLDEEVQAQLDPYDEEEADVVLQEFKRLEAMMNGEKERIRSRFL